MDATATLNAALTGRYEIERELGRGGMATVYLARDLRHDRRVAVKVLDPELGAILGVERFLSEIRVTANLQHPHLLPLFDSGAAGGLLYYVMPYVEGESLRARLDREKQLPVDEAVRLATAVLAALDYAHGHSVVHRDLKPENILLQHGEPVVADFGIALAVSNAGGARVTQTGLSLGTPQYMSPEQATGDRLIDARSDIYSMGAVLYEMLAGEPPHTGASVQAIIAKVITERPRSLRIGRDTVPEPVDHAVLKALAKIPADRWSSARAFADALRGGGTLVASSGRGFVASLGRSARRVGGSVAFWRGAAVVIAVVAGVLAWTVFRAPAPTGEFQLTNQLTFDGKVIGAAISPDGGWLAYVTDDCFGKDVICTHSLQVREVDGTQSLKLVTWPGRDGRCGGYAGVLYGAPVCARRLAG
jgi:eukaryotic-like serine/threonine-protein kinase